MSKKDAVRVYERETAADGKQCRVGVLKNAWKKSGLGLTLKQFAREHELGAAWFASKRANAKAPLKKIGRTRKRIKSSKRPHGGQSSK